MLNRASVEVSERYEFREWLGFATPNFLTSIVDTVLDSTDTLLLAFFAISNVAIGQYAAAIKISIFIALPLQSLNVMFTPTIAELYSKGEIEKLKAMFKIVTKWVITFSLPIFWIAALFSKSLLSLSGNIFGEAWPLLVAFAIGGIVNAGTGSVGYMLLMTGHQKLSFLNSLAAVVVNVILGIILTPRYGAMGTAIATGLAICVINLMRLLQVRLILKMQPYRRDTLKPILAGFISAAVTGVLLYLVNNANLTFKLFHVVYLSADLALIPVFLGLYGLLLALFKLDPEDQIVVGALRKKFKRGKK
jgi:O-antigen/teichoic acid export membrane protein